MSAETLTYPFTGTLMGRAVKAAEDLAGEPMSASPIGNGWEGSCPVCEQASLLLDFDPGQPNAVFAYCQPQYGDGCDLGLIYAALQIDAPTRKYQDNMTADPAEEYEEDLAAKQFERDVAERAYQVAVSDAARERVSARKAAQVQHPPLTALDVFLAEPDDDPEFRIDRLLPTGASGMLVAQYKAGKSTLVGNLIRSLADGEPFLGAHPVQPARVALIDNELDPRTLRRWLRDQQIRNTRRVQLVSLRGRVSTFNILDPTIRASWARELEGVELFIFDCLRPVLDSLGLSEDKDAGRFLVALDALKHESAVSEGLVVHHMGHQGERSRGDSRLLDWPDVTWKLVRESSDDPSSRRYFSAFGRDVDVPESALDYDPETRHLTLVGGNRKDAEADELIPVIVEVLSTRPEGMSGRQIEAALTEDEYPRSAIRAGLKLAEQRGFTLVTEGPRRARVHHLNPSAPVRRSAP